MPAVRWQISRTGRLLVSCAVLVACGGGGGSGQPDGATEPTGPTESGPSLRILAGSGISDSVDARLGQPLLVEVRDSTGRLASGRSVRFRTVSEPDGRLHVMVSTEAAPPYSNVATATTDEVGRASVRILLGTALGPARLAVSVPDLGVADTARFSVVPGMPDHIDFVTADTAVTPGATYALGTTLRDRYGHLAPGETPTYVPGPGVSAVTPTGQVTVGAAVARGEIRVAWRTVVDTARVSIVPRMRLAVYRISNRVDGSPKGMLVTDADNTGTVVFDDFGFSPHAVGTSPMVVYHDGDERVDASIRIASPGNPSRVLVEGAFARPRAWPRLSPDGAWVYFIVSRSWDRSLWRIRPDGTEADSLGAFANFASSANLAPAIAPDGRTVAVDEDGQLRFFDVVTRSSRTIVASCSGPRYSPDGSLIACIWKGQLRVMASDGTAVRIVPYDTRFAAPYNVENGVDWTPDGQWLVSYLYGEGLVLIDPTTGARIPIVRAPGIEDRYPSVVR